jgi:transcriptional regulator with XRE-family HTH domain
MFFRKEITPRAVRAFRRRRGWTLEQMADAVWATAREVAAWEAGTVRVPRDQVRRMREISAASPEPPVPRAPRPERPWRCAWADAHAPGLHDLLRYEPAEVKSNLAVQRHLAECPTCQRAYELGRQPREPAAPPPPAPPPAIADPELDDPLVEIGRALDRLPPTVRLPLLGLAGAAGIAALTLLVRRLVDAGLSGPAGLWMEAIVFGGTFVLAGRFAGKLLGRRPYAVGLLAAVGAIMAAMTTWNLRTPDAQLGDPLVVGICAVLTLLAALGGGWVRNAAWEDYDAEWWRSKPDDTPPAAPLVLPPRPPTELEELPLQARPEYTGAPARADANPP